MVGGHSAPAYRRAVARAHGWYGYALPPQQAAASVAGLAATARHVQRPAGLGELEISVMPRGPITPELAEQFALAGVHRLVLLAPPTADGVGPDDSGWHHGHLPSVTTTGPGGVSGPQLEPRTLPPLRAVRFA